jgi:hypothetical protein
MFFKVEKQSGLLQVPQQWIKMKKAKKTLTKELFSCLHLQES